MICITCNKKHNYDFCPNCGESSSVKKITFRSTLENAFSSITDMDKGLFFNLKHLTISPQKIITQYIGGKRKGVFNPITYALLLISIYILIDSFDTIKEQNAFKSALQDNTVYQSGAETGRFLWSNLKYFWLLSIIYLSIFTKLFFGKYNFFEHLAINSFIIGHSTLTGIICLLLFKWPIFFNPFVGLTILLLLYATFKNEKDKFETIALSFGATLFSYILFFIIPIVIATLTK